MTVDDAAALYLRPFGVLPRLGLSAAAPGVAVDVEDSSDRSHQFTTFRAGRGVAITTIPCQETVSL